VLVNNLPYIAMIALGGVILVAGSPGSLWGFLAGGAYLVYGLAGAVWIMIFVCPYCRYWNTDFCPCGYGTIAARFRQRKTVDCFNEKFKRHIPVIVPLWFIPLLAGLILMGMSFSWLLLALTVIFAVDAFAVLPVFSIRHGCTECPQKDTCPWMGRKLKSAAC